MSDLHDRDFYAWTMAQAVILRSGKLTDADVVNIAEEIESMGRSEHGELVSRLQILLLHLLKWEHQPERRGRSWALSVVNTQDELMTHVQRNPSLKPKTGEAVIEAYRRARRAAAAETCLSLASFPAVSPWTFQDAMDFKFGVEEE